MPRRSNNTNSNPLSDSNPSTSVFSNVNSNSNVNSITLIASTQSNNLSNNVNSIASNNSGQSDNALTGRKRGTPDNSASTAQADSKLPPAKRTSPRVKVSTAKAPFYLEPPRWGEPISRHLGGSRMEVTLGIGALNAVDNTGEKKTNKRPGIMRTLLQDEGKTPQTRKWWKAGHLLNADFGGTGQTYNLTPLTAAANSAHEEWETKLRASLDILRQTLERTGRLDLKNHVGIKFVVEVNQAMTTAEIFKGGKATEKEVPGGVSGSIQLVSLNQQAISDDALKALFRQSSNNQSNNNSNNNMDDDVKDNSNIFDSNNNTGNSNSSSIFNNNNANNDMNDDSNNVFGSQDNPFYDPQIEERGLGNIFNLEEQSFEAYNELD
jgi:hypothetical protein